MLDDSAGFLPNVWPMKSWQFQLNTALGGLSLILVIVVVILSQNNRGIQNELQQQQQVIQQGQLTQQVGTAIVRDMAQLSLRNQRVKELLARHGYNITQQNQ